MLKPALICCPVAALMTVLAWSAAPAPQLQKKTVAPKAPANSSENRSPQSPRSPGKGPVSVHKTIANSTARAGATTAKAGAGRPIVRRTGTRQVRTAAAWRPRQWCLAGTLQEIQDALASRGYLQPDQATGVWDQNSVDALNASR